MSATTASDSGSRPEPAIRLLPAATPRVESGATQFGDDWPGVFIRGDNAGYLAMGLKGLLHKHGKALPVWDVMLLQGVQRLLASGVVGPAAALVAGDSLEVLMQAAPDGLPEDGQYFRHVDGGLYRKTGSARSSEGGAPMVVYEHLWPFERGTWVRPEHEFAERFAPVALADVRTQMAGDAQAARRAVTDAKAARRAAASRPD